jgi:hypothetical protein
MATPRSCAARSPADEAERYLGKAPGAFVLKRRRSTIVITAVRKGSVGAVKTSLTPAQSFGTALVASAGYEEQWFGRVFLYDPTRRVSNVEGLGLLARVVDFTAPALHSVFLIRRLRSRSEASERRTARARAARHVGPIADWSRDGGPRPEPAYDRLDIARCHQCRAFQTAV